MKILFNITVINDFIKITKPFLAFDIIWLLYYASTNNQWKLILMSIESDLIP